MPENSNEGPEWEPHSQAVARAGIEPATYRFSGGRSYQLSYLAVPGNGPCGRAFERRSPYRTGLERLKSACARRRPLVWLCGMNRVLVGQAGEAVKPRVLAGMADVHDDERLPAGALEEIPVDAITVETALPSSVSTTSSRNGWLFMAVGPYFTSS